MKARQVWELNTDELARKERELRDQIFKMRFQLATGQMDNPLKLRAARKDLARVMTVLTARKKKEPVAVAAGSAGAAPPASGAAGAVAAGEASRKES